MVTKQGKKLFEYYLKMEATQNCHKLMFTKKGKNLLEYFQKVEATQNCHTKTRWQVGFSNLTKLTAQASQTFWIYTVRKNENIPCTGFLASFHIGSRSKGEKRVLQRSGSGMRYHVRPALPSTPINIPHTVWKCSVSAKQEIFKYNFDGKSVRSWHRPWWMDRRGSPDCYYPLSPDYNSRKNGFHPLSANLLLSSIGWKRNFGTKLMRIGLAS